MRNEFSYIIFIIIMSLSLCGCKPTEKGYKAAYDAAVNKRTAADEREHYDENLPVVGLLPIDGPHLKKIGGSEYYVLSEPLKIVGDDVKKLEQYNVALACYKMPTNCKSHVKDLEAEGFKAFVARSGEDKFYAIAGTFPTETDATKFIDQITNKKNRIYIGLPEAPVIILLK